MTIEKSLGYDWNITYEDDDEGKIKLETMTVFGVMTIEQALYEARYSLNSIVPYTGAIISVERQ